MIIFNDISKEVIHVDFKKLPSFVKYEQRKIKGKIVEMRVWYEGWFPRNPVKGYDIRCARRHIGR